jgi:hypothetical protein
MSIRLVSLADVKTQLAYDSAAHDAELAFRLEAVSGAIMTYLDGASFDGWTDSSGNLLTDSSGDPATDSSGASVVPGAVRAAVICAMASWDEDRTVDILTPAVIALLTPYRTPIVT